MQSPNGLSQTEFHDWEVVPYRWWETEYGAVSWTFTDKPRGATTNVAHAQPPHYHGSLLRYSRPVRRSSAFSRSSPSGILPARPGGDASVTYTEELNLDHVGARAVEEVLAPYEISSGFCHSIMPDLMLHLQGCSTLSVDIDEKDVKAGKLIWDELARELVGPDISSGGFLEHGVDAYRPLSALSSSDYDSEHSTDSDPFPRTPTQKNSFADVEVHQPSPVAGSHGISPSKALNVSARSFTPNLATPVKYPSLLASPSPAPTNSSSPSPTPLNFTFPSINGNYQYLPPNLKKDEQGFYTAVTPPGSPARSRNDPTRPASRLSTTRLPSSLPRKTSKTREIVDQLRSTPSAGKKSRSRGRSKSGAPQNSPGVESPDSGDNALAADSTAKPASKTDDQSQLSEANSNSNGWIELPPRASEHSYTLSDKYSPPSIPSAHLPNTSPQMIAGPFPSAPQPPAGHFFPQPQIVRHPQFFPVYARPPVMPYMAPPPPPHGAWIPVYPPYPVPLTGTSGMRHAQW
ncbi:hypothetical protein BV22DRAFT_1126319 [Leucogyrophana mollusca]|uniref:Uncharacterized protein n=1 Tax=Leucogyrophana mollusca TaxID=85980 RepID=A0ACB8BTD6_9AGAM|nr:hypothetical protein BV22DRAFT_1126319 [Leucogyrophana mollusca]